MWIFDTPKSYSDMIKKIAWTTFFIVLIGLILITHMSEGFNNLMKTLSCGIQLEYNSLKLYISYIWIPLVFAIFENIFKLHDRISDLFKIRYNYDRKIIIKGFIIRLNVDIDINKVTFKNRDMIMSDIFYKYAGYAHPVIDEHLIAMALGAWCWYWIIIDTLLVTVLLSIVILILEFSILKLIVIVVVCLFLLLLLYMIMRKECIKYSKLEVDAILKDSSRKTEIKGYLQNALSN